MKAEKSFILIASVVLILVPVLVQPRINALFSGEERVISIKYGGTIPRVMYFHYFFGLALGCLITWTYIKEKYQVHLFLLVVTIIVLQTVFAFQLAELFR